MPPLAMPPLPSQLLRDDSAVYSASRDRTILMWDLRSETRERYMAQRMGAINAVDLLPDQSKLISVGQEKVCPHAHAPCPHAHATRPRELLTLRWSFIRGSA